VHLICDNLSTHKTPAINAWLSRHPRFHPHFTPTGSSWINQVERWFGYLTDQLLRRRRAQKRAGAGERRPRLDQNLERRPKTLRMDQDRRRDPRLPRTIYLTNLGRRTLGSRWGTEPAKDGKYTSGTEEEFYIAKDCIERQSAPMKDILVLFKGVPDEQMAF